MRALLPLLLLAGCAGHACRTASVLPQPQPQVEIVEHYVVIRDRPVHQALLADYAHALSAEKPLVIHSQAPTINRLISLNNAARAAFAPIESRTHHATAPEIAKAVAALGALNDYVSQKR
jgi:hypothetical protein